MRADTDRSEPTTPSEDAALPSATSQHETIIGTGDSGVGGEPDPAMADAVDREAATTESPHGWKPRRALTLGIAVLTGVVIAALAVCAIGLGLDHRDARAAADRDRTIIDAARRATLDLISPTYREPDAGADRIVESATGAWLAEFEATRDRFVGAVAESQTESVGEILGAGIERHDPDGSTVVLVSAVSKVTNSSGASDDPRTWRLRVVVVSADGGHKLSKVEVVP